MKELPIRLNQIVNPREIRRKYIGHMHTLNNSFKRNTMYSTHSNDQTSSYQCRLPQVNFARKDLAQILICLLGKEEMGLPDRNLLRRILVAHFDEQLIRAGSRNFIHHLKVQEQQKYTYSQNPKQKLFYLLLKGEATVTTGGFTYTVNTGGTFGQLQILSSSSIQYICYKANTLLLTLSELHFNNYFRHYFQIIYQRKFEEMECIRQNFLDHIPKINTYLLVDKIQSKTLKRGDIITEQGDKLERIYFMGNGWKEEKPKTMIHGCVGLQEYLKKKPCYAQNVFCLQQNLYLPSVPKDIFQLYIGSFISNHDSNHQYTAVPKIKDRAYTQASNPQVVKKSLNLMRIKKVKLIYSRTFKTESLQSMVSNFKFLKMTDIDTKKINLNSFKDLQNRRQRLMSEGKCVI